MYAKLKQKKQKKKKKKQTTEVGEKIDGRLIKGKEVTDRQTDREQSREQSSAESRGVPWLGAHQNVCMYVWNVTCMYV